MQYHTLNREELVGALHTADTGLDLSEVGQRLEHYGPNEIGRKKRKNYLKEYFVQFTHFLRSSSNWRRVCRF